MRKKLELEERPVFNVVTLYRERGNYLQRIELFEKAILAFYEALRWNNTDVKSLLGRSVARSKATHYVGAFQDAFRARVLEPDNVDALEVMAQTEYNRCAFEKALVLASKGQRIRKFPSNFAECARHAEETIRECVGDSARKVLTSSIIPILDEVDKMKMSIESDAPIKKIRHSRMAPTSSEKTQEISRTEKQKTDRISKLMASKYLERMAYDKYFLKKLVNDERLVSANMKGSTELQELAKKALNDIEKRQTVLRERRPLYAARAAEEVARARLSQKRRQEITINQQEHTTVAKRLIQSVMTAYEEQNTAKCLENAEFALERISKKPCRLLPNKEKFMQEIFNLVSGAFLNQLRVRRQMSEEDREKRAFVMLELAISREPSRDSVLKVRPQPLRNPKHRFQQLEHNLSLAKKHQERCYLLHELARLSVDMKQAYKAKFYSYKCQNEAKASNEKNWLLNATFLLAKSYILQNNRPEARVALLEGSSLAKSYGGDYKDIAAFFDTCAVVSIEGELAAEEKLLEKREKEMVSLMQDEDMRSAAKDLFRRMSTIPVERRFSVMPGARVESTVATSATSRRQSIMPKGQAPTTHIVKSKHPLGFQEFDL